MNPGEKTQTHLICVGSLLAQAGIIFSLLQICLVFSFEDI